MKQHIRLEMDYEQMNHLHDSFNASNKGIEIDVPNSIKCGYSFCEIGGR